MNPISSFLVALCILAGVACGVWPNPFAAAPFFVMAALVSMSLKMANVREKFVVLRMGKLQGVKGAGLFLIVPVIDSVIAVIDGRIQTTAFNAEQTSLREMIGSSMLAARAPPRGPSPENSSRRPRSTRVTPSRSSCGR